VTQDGSRQNPFPDETAKIDAANTLDAAEILSSVGEAAYDWQIGSDVLLWSANAAKILLIPDMDAVASGRGYAQTLEAENAQARYDAVMQSDKRDDGHGVPYQIQYRIRPDPASETRLWVEDTGRWFAGPDRLPARAQGVLRVINERYEHERQLNFLARYDGLTGELNRHHLTEILEDTIDDAIRFRSSCGFLLVAIDNLARINESYGFDTADQVIAEVAKRVHSRMRGKDTLGRYSGNKFGVVLRDCTPDDMAIAAERLLAAIREDMVATAAGPIAVTTTIGGVTAPRHARSVAEVHARAQDALDAAKAKRRGSFLAYRPNVEREALRRDNIRATDEIVAALNERRIFLAYETVVAATDRKPAFYECLMRIRRTDGVLVGAASAAPTASSSAPTRSCRSPSVLDWYACSTIACSNSSSTNSSPRPTCMQASTCRRPPPPIPIGGQVSPRFCVRIPAQRSA